MLANIKCSSHPPGPSLQTYPFSKMCLYSGPSVCCFFIVKKTRTNLVPKEVSFQLLASVKPVTLIPVRANCGVTLNSPPSLLQQGLKAWVEASSRTGKDKGQLLLLEIKGLIWRACKNSFPIRTPREKVLCCFQPVSREMVFHHSSSDYGTVHYTGETWQPHLNPDKDAILSPHLVSAVP